MGAAGSLPISDNDNEFTFSKDYKEEKHWSNVLKALKSPLSQRKKKLPVHRTHSDPLKGSIKNMHLQTVHSTTDVQTSYNRLFADESNLELVEEHQRSPNNYKFIQLSSWNPQIINNKSQDATVQSTTLTHSRSLCAKQDKKANSTPKTSYSVCPLGKPKLKECKSLPPIQIPPASCHYSQSGRFSKINEEQNLESSPLIVNMTLERGEERQKPPACCVYKKKDETLRKTDSPDGRRFNHEKYRIQSSDVISCGDANYDCKRLIDKDLSAKDRLNGTNLNRMSASEYGENSHVLFASNSINRLETGVSESRGNSVVNQNCGNVIKPPRQKIQAAPTYSNAEDTVQDTLQSSYQQNYYSQAEEKIFGEQNHSTPLNAGNSTGKSNTNNRNGNSKFNDGNISAVPFNYSTIDSNCSSLESENEALREQLREKERTWLKEKAAVLKYQRELQNRYLEILNENNWLKTRLERTDCP